MSDGTRVVLVQPGDVLLIGGVGQIDHDGLAEAVAYFREQLGLDRVMLFAADIDMAVAHAPESSP